MKLSLIPRSHPKYGQDYRQLVSANSLDLTKWYKNGEDYPEPDWTNTELIISFNSDDSADKRLIEKAPKTVPVVVHHQLQRKYLNSKSKKNTDTVLLRATYIVIPADFLRIQFSEVKNKILTIHNGIPNNVFRAIDDKKKTIQIKQLKMPSQKKIAGFIGEPTIAKGGDILKKLANSLPDDWVLVLCSTGDPPSWVLNNPNIIFLKQELDQLGHFHPTPLFDVLLSLSLCEVAPMVVIEAMMSGIPALATLSSPYLTQIKNEIEDGLLDLFELPNYLNNKQRSELSLNDNDIERIAEKITSKLKDLPAITASTRKELSKRTKDCGYDSSKMIGGFDEIYTRAINLKNSPNKKIQRTQKDALLI